VECGVSEQFTVRLHKTLIVAKYSILAIQPALRLYNVTCWLSSIFQLSVSVVNFKTTFLKWESKLFTHFMSAMCGCQNA
jgi:hypothetical protein